MSCATQVPSLPLSLFSPTGLSPALVGLSRAVRLTDSVEFVDGPTTPRVALLQPRFGLLRVRSPLLAESLLFSSPPATKMFQFTGFASGFAPDTPCGVGCPIRKSASLWVFAPRRGLSQLITSFFASESQGILYVPLSPFFISFEILTSTACAASVLSVARVLFLSSSMSMCVALFRVVLGRVELPTSTLSV